MGDSSFWTSFMVSVKRVVIGTVWTMVVIIMMAYPLSKTSREYKPRNILMWILIFCMLFNGGTIPWFITVKNYGLIDTLAALILAGSVPVFNVILLMNFFRNLPSDLEEAAKVDGAGPWRTLWQIVVPCSKPVIATVVLFTSVGYWNEYFQGLVLMNNESHYPLQTYIRQITVQIPVGVTLTAEQYQKLATNSNKSLEAAKVFIAMIPMLIVYPFLQKYFVNGITLGAVKE
jgi:multiple sugar transport system permease protein/putative aldouronate transport system permease protein